MNPPYQTIQPRQEDGATVVKVLCEEMRSESVIAQFEQEMDDYLNRTGCTGVVLDMAGVNFMTSSGLRALIVLRRKLRQQGGRYTMCSVHPHLASVFRTTRLFAENVDYLNDVPSAISALKEPVPEP